MMSNSIRSAYYALPPLGRDLVASIHGFRLRRWRYGSETNVLVKEALERETWTHKRWRNWRQAQLQRMLRHAATSVPFYRDYWRTRSGSDDGCALLELSNWPVLKKESVRKNPEAFLSVNSGKDLRIEDTSGTTGTPLKLWHDRTAARSWYALMEARWRGWYGVSRQDRWGILGGQLVTPVGQKNPPFWVWNAGLRQLYLSSYHLSPSTVDSYIQAMRRSEITYLWGYASSLFSLALLATERQIKPPQLEVVISNAEPLYS